MAQDFTELFCWQLARELKLVVLELVKRPKVSRDFDFVRQITDAAASGPRNIAEGFGRFNRKEFAQLLKIAISSEMEVRNHFIDGFDRGYLTQIELDAWTSLSKRAVTAAARMASLFAIGSQPVQVSARNPANPANPENLANPENPPMLR